MSNDRVLEEDHLPLHVLEYLLMPNDRVGGGSPSATCTEISIDA
jgi:hypothetical protein